MRRRCRPRCPPITSLIFKGTHNSYDPRRLVTPLCQVEDFGAWAIELDYLSPEGSADLYVGHDGPCHPADCDADAGILGPATLADQLADLAVAPSLQYRPLFLYLEFKPLDSDRYYRWPSTARVWRDLTSQVLRQQLGYKLMGPAAVKALGRPQQSMAHGSRERRGNHSHRDHPGLGMAPIGTPLAASTNDAEFAGRRDL